MRWGGRWLRLRAAAWRPVALTPALSRGGSLIYGADLVYERCDTGKVRDLARTVRSGLSPFPWTAPLPPPSEGDEDFSPLSLEIVAPPYPCFLLALTRRSFALPKILSLFRLEGLQCDGIIEGGSWDIFDNDTDGLTDMWRDSVLSFTPIHTL